MHRDLSRFLKTFQNSFVPAPPYRGKAKNTWLMSRVWSESLRNWFKDHYRGIWHEFPVGDTGRRLDAALYHQELANPRDKGARMDLAIEWEWDHNKVRTQFGGNDFRKLFEVPATCGVAIVHTRIDGRRGSQQATDVIRGLRQQQIDYGRTHGQRDVAIIEFRRILHTRTEVRFDACYWLNGSDKSKFLGHWDYAGSLGKERRVERSDP
ncbi:MAG: hypothetical protein ACK5TO_08925 [Planctomycetaceae bacterium]